MDRPAGDVVHTEAGGKVGQHGRRRGAPSEHPGEKCNGPRKPVRRRGAIGGREDCQPLCFRLINIGLSGGHRLFLELASRPARTMPTPTIRTRPMGAPEGAALPRPPEVTSCSSVDAVSFVLVSGAGAAPLEKVHWHE